ncbi:hydroxyacid dehydrogenase [Paenibacillus allorhizosphaerae]|uniref:Formate dehydrogenase, mitochondrial n=1 Tax=Paenibacillus allorhizosphaerae TaxID=2849866 RepID=A0ABM8VIU6_9BACL|nr:hydroxyacid dehydrogenase [Paenibacillus allorhizosphaerae]CAG7644553.1 Formate dehydrogenase, mitochondrial [Paenibacillus allorhizosphaerae]
MKIAILPSTVRQNAVFAQEHIAELKTMGEVVCNKTEGDPSKEQVMEAIHGADVAITSWGCPALTADVLDRAPNLKLIVHAAGTIKGIASPDVWERGIRVSSGNGPLGQGVAETALGFTITALKNMWTLNRSTHSGGWKEGRDRVREMVGVRIGVLGAGKAGRHYIQLLKLFDVQVLVHDPFLSAAEAQQLGVTLCSLEEMLAASDVVSIHAPSLPSTNKMINKERLALMKDGAILINTARGSIIDESALIPELQSGRLFACLDVTDPEPPAADHPFRTLPNCVLTPHIAGAVTNGLRRLGRFAVTEVRHFTAGQPLTGEVEASALSTLA